MNYRECCSLIRNKLHPILTGTSRHAKAQCRSCLDGVSRFLQSVFAGLSPVVFGCESRVPGRDQDGIRAFLSGKLAVLGQAAAYEPSRLIRLCRQGIRRQRSSLVHNLTQCRGKSDERVLRSKKSWLECRTHSIFAYVFLENTYRPAGRVDEKLTTSRNKPQIGAHSVCTEKKRRIAPFSVAHVTNQNEAITVHLLTLLPWRESFWAAWINLLFDFVRRHPGA